MRISDCCAAAHAALLRRAEQKPAEPEETPEPEPLPLPQPLPEPQPQPERASAAMLDIEDIVSAGMCSGCGLCLSIDLDSPTPQGPQLEMRKTSSGHLRPAFRHPTAEGRAAREALSAKVG